MDKLKEAIVTLDALRKVTPKDPNVNYLRALAAYRQNDFVRPTAMSRMRWPSRRTSLLRG